MNPAQPTGRQARGFTLIELLIVISIIGVLAAVLLPEVLGASEAANETATKTTMMQLETACNTFQRSHGYYPTDDLRYVEDGAKTKWNADNGQNTGIESLVCMVSQSRQDGTDLTGLGEHFVNTDGDSHGAALPMLGNRRDRIEIADAWKTPLVYFAQLGMDKPQTVALGEDLDPVQVKAKRKDNGEYYGKGKFQLLSAGQDMTFGTDDDLVWPSN